MAELIHAELLNLWLFFAAIWKCGSMTGLIVVLLLVGIDMLLNLRAEKGAHRGH